MTTNFTLSGQAKFPVALKMTSSVNTLTAGVSTLLSFSLSAEDSNPHNVLLYSKGSKSSPQINPLTRWSHLVSQWRFLDYSNNIIDYLTLTDYSTAIISSTMGYIFSGSCIYIDDIASNDIELRATVDYFDYPTDIDISKTKIDTLQLSSCVNSTVTASLPLTAIGFIPQDLQIDYNGIEPLEGFYWSNSYIPFFITVRGPANQIYFDWPIDQTSICHSGSPWCQLYNTETQTYVTPVSWIPTVSSIIPLTDPQGFKNGAVLSGVFLTTESMTGAQISATFTIDYIDPTTGAKNYKQVTGVSDIFSILKWEEQGLEFRKFNESWESEKYIREIQKTPHIYNNTVLWDGYMNAVWGDENTPYEDAFGRKVYEKIANFLDNHNDVDTCNIAQLYSLANSTDVPIDNYGLYFPDELRRLLDNLSINLEELKGCRCKCNQNIKNKYIIGTNETTGLTGVPVKYYCDVCNHEHAGNRGNLQTLSLSTTISAYNPFIIKDVFTGGKYEYYYPQKNSAGLSVYALSSEYLNMFELDSSFTFNDFKERFCFFDYISTFCDYQVEGVINFDDKNTTLSENITSLNDWYGDKQKSEIMINYILHKGLGLII